MKFQHGDRSLSLYMLKHTYSRHKTQSDGYFRFALRLFGEKIGSVKFKRAGLHTQDSSE